MVAAGYFAWGCSSKNNVALPSPLSAIIEFIGLPEGAPGVPIRPMLKQRPDQRLRRIMQASIAATSSASLMRRNL